MADNNKILIVEDENAIVDTIAYALKTEGFEAKAANTAAAALNLVREWQPALVILDVGLPDQSGFDLCRELRSFSTVPIIFLTARNSEIDRVLGLELGADDYVLKPFSPRELVARVKACLRRVNEVPSFGSQTQAAKDFQIDAQRLKILYQGQALELSRYEYRLLAVLIARPGRVYSREELMNLAWEDPDMSLERTVDAHIKNIRAKLRELNPQDDSIVTQRGFGYFLRED